MTVLPGPVYASPIAIIQNWTSARRFDAENPTCRQTMPSRAGSFTCRGLLYFSTSTPRQKATKPLIFRAAGLGSG